MADDQGQRRDTAIEDVPADGLPSDGMPRALMRPLAFARLPEARMHEVAAGLAQQMAERRSVRAFSTDPVPREVIEACLAIAAPFLVLPVGYPAPDAEVPDTRRRPLEAVVVWR